MFKITSYIKKRKRLTNLNEKVSVSLKSLDTDILLCWGTAKQALHNLVMESGFLQNALHMDYKGLYQFCSLCEFDKEYKPPISYERLKYNTKYRQFNNDSWDGVVLAAQVPRDRSISISGGQNHYWDFIEKAAKFYGKHLFIKLHPKNAKKETISRYLEIAKKYGCRAEKGGIDLIKRCKFVIVYNSTFSFDCFMNMVPVIQYAPGYFYKTGAVYFSDGNLVDEVPKGSDDRIKLGRKLVDFCIWKYMIHREISKEQWVSLLTDFILQEQKELFPLKEEYSYGASLDKI